MSNTDPIKILNKGKSRSREYRLPYDGAFFPIEVGELIRAEVNLTIVDVRTHPEWVFVGNVPNSLHIEWQIFPTGAQNPNFINSLRELTAKEDLLIFMCRSGIRSHDAAITAKLDGFLQVFNMLEGFEGDLDSSGKRNRSGGWKCTNLPWRQS